MGGVERRNEDGGRASGLMLGIMKATKLSLFGVERNRGKQELELPENFHVRSGPGIHPPVPDDSAESIVKLRKVATLLHSMRDLGPVNQRNVCSSARQASSVIIR